MKRYVLLLAIIVVAICITVNWENTDFSLAVPSSVTTKISITDDGISRKLRIDTIMYAGGYSFGYEDDTNGWEGWYFDTIQVGDDKFLRYDSVSPASIKLSLITKSAIVNLVATDAQKQIEEFLEPIGGFQRFQKHYEVCIDSVYDEENGLMKCMGYFSFTADYADSCIVNAAK